MSPKSIVIDAMKGVLGEEYKKRRYEGRPERAV